MEAKFEYVIKVDGEVVWQGLNPKEKYWEIKKQNPDKEVAIAWQTKEKVLVRNLYFLYSDKVTFRFISKNKILSRFKRDLDLFINKKLPKPFSPISLLHIHNLSQRSGILHHEVGRFLGISSLNPNFMSFDREEAETKIKKMKRLYQEEYEIFSRPVFGLPAGTYIFYFGVDTDRDGDITWDNLYYDTVVVNISE